MLLIELWESGPLFNQSNDKRRHSHCQSLCQIPFSHLRQRYSSTVPDLPFSMEWLYPGERPEYWYTFVLTCWLITRNDALQGSNIILTSRFSRSLMTNFVTMVMTTMTKINAEDGKECLHLPPLILPFLWYCTVRHQKYWCDNTLSTSGIHSGSIIP